MGTETQVRKITDFIDLDKHCKKCGKKSVLKVSSSDLDDYKSGTKLIQRCFPYLTSNEREMFISGYCGECFDELYKD